MGCSLSGESPSFFRPNSSNSLSNSSRFCSVLVLLSRLIPWRVLFLARVARSPPSFSPEALLLLSSMSTSTGSATPSLLPNGLSTGSSLSSYRAAKALSASSSAANWRLSSSSSCSSLADLRLVFSYSSLSLASSNSWSCCYSFSLSLAEYRSWVSSSLLPRVT